MPYDDICSENDCPVIIGLSCRVPGARGRDEMWRVLSGGRCTIGEADATFNPDLFFDPHRTRLGRTYSFATGQLENVYHFDPGFFGISPREALQMDPQQKLMLSAVWEAIEDSGLAPACLSGDRTGVFIGASIDENLGLYYADPTRANSSFSLGNTLCIIANRVSAFFDFGGPSYVLDAACASGLYALHNASEALRRCELDTAIVGSVAVSRTPGGYIGFSQARMVSPTGLCRAFDADADGYVRSEACVALVLQRPEVADRMLARRRARLLATGINADGGASQLTVPSAARQERLIEEVMLRSRRDPEDLAFYEAHGTGTAVGDPIEASSLGGAVGSLRREPLLIGSSKTNFGHAEPASGLVGLAKTLLSFEHGALPASLHFKKPNPNIDFETLNIKVNTKLRSLPEKSRAIAGINAFGFGGTNVTAIVESMTSAPARYLPVTNARTNSEAVYAMTGRLADEESWLLFSAASEGSLRSIASSFADLLESSPPGNWKEIAAACAAKAELRLRATLPLDADTPEILRTFSKAGEHAKIIRGTEQIYRGQTALAFPGNGVQFEGMGRSEYEAFPTFRDEFDKISAAFAEHGISDLVGVMYAKDLAERLGNPLVAQPLLFAYQVAFVRHLEHAGLRYEAVIGHSFGEIAALYLAGCFDLKAAAKNITARSESFTELRGMGGMAAIAGSEEQVEQALKAIDDPALVVAAVNGPRSVTVSGPQEAISRLSHILVDGKRLAMMRLNVEIPYHSPALDSLQQRFISGLEGTEFLPQNCIVAGSAVGRILSSLECNSEYLWRNARDKVRFASALKALSDVGAWNVVEISPQSLFSGNVRDLARYNGLPLGYHFPDSSEQEVQREIARAWTQGVSVDVTRLAGQKLGPAPDLPSYPWEESEYQTSLSVDGLDLWGEAGGRYIVGNRPERSAASWMAEFTPTWPSWCADHKVGDGIVLPATALVEIALGATAEYWPDAVVELRDFDILAAARVENQGVRIRTAIDPATRVLTMSFRPRLMDTNWTPLVRATVRKAEGAAPGRMRLPARFEDEVTGVYDFLSDRGLVYGAGFRRLNGLRFVDNYTLWVRLAAPVQNGRFRLDVMAADAVFHGLAAVAYRHASKQHCQIAKSKVDLIADMLKSQAALLPVRVGAMRLWLPEDQPVHARIKLRKIRTRSIVADFILCNAENRIIAEIEAVEFISAHLDARREIAPTRTVSNWHWLRPYGHQVALPRGWNNHERALQRLGSLDRPALKTVGSTIVTLRNALAIADGSAKQALAEVIKADPDLTDDMRALVLLARGEDSGNVALHGKMLQLIWGKAQQLLLDPLVRSWRKGERLNLLLRGFPAVSLLRQLVRNPRINRLALSGLSGRDLDLLRQILPSEFLPLIIEMSTGEREFDIILSAGFKVESRGIESHLAVGGLAFMLDFPDFMPEVAQSDGNLAGEWSCVHIDTDPLPIRLRSLRLCKISEVIQLTPIRPVLIGGLPSDLPLEITKLIPWATDGDKPSHRLIVLSYKPEDDPVTVLRDMLWRLRFEMVETILPLIILCTDNAGDGNFDVVVAGLASFLRTMRNETPDMKGGLIALQGLPRWADKTIWPRLFDMLLQDAVLRVDQDGIRTERFSLHDLEDRTGSAMHLELGRSGHLETLAWVGRRRVRPDRGEIEIDVKATGLNFRDVMLARGLLPERSFDNGASGAGFGMECAGIVSRVGPGCTVKPGTRVMAFAPSAFASHVVIPEHAASLLPEGISLESGAAMPVAFVTAWEALVKLAKIREGDSVLIHGAAGGVGLAAIQIAKMFGARVLATAGTAEKRLLVCASGAEAVFSSRNLNFAQELRAATSGHGVNIVLNSLSGEAMQRSVECLAPFGRFIELGKRDYLEGTQLDLRPFARSLSYFGFDLDQRLAEDPEGVAQTLRDIRAAFSDGRLRPLPVTIFNSGDTEEALRHMLAARHTGKIVIRPAVSARAHAKRPIRGEWVIIGGTGGVGLAIAHALVELGVSRIHLVSRYGEVGLGTGNKASWAASAEQLQYHALDASDPEQLAGFFSGLDACGCEIGGVIHAAMVLRDRLMVDIDQEEAELVLRAKLGIAHNLDKALRARPDKVDHVIFLSSIAAKLGNPGQAAYSAANAAMETLVALRNRDGQPGLAIGFGPIGNIGYLTRESILAAQLSKLDGLGLLKISTVIDELMRAITMPPTENYCFAAIDWALLARRLPTFGASTFTRLVQPGATNHPATGEIIKRLRTLEWPAAMALVNRELSDILCTIMRMPREQFDLKRPLSSYGVDSLMAMELRLEVESRFGCNLPVMSLSESITGARLSTSLLAQIRGEECSTGLDENTSRHAASLIDIDRHPAQESLDDSSGTISDSLRRKRIEE